ncbi:MAG: FAD-binding oxidoreductase [Rhizobiaceae bacterium]|nr:FAD-binding oxidoreductase [Rhizobiaceae bacterium]MCV0408993.1 FAD-binding oxidoreductase [Rhizobiaceae bacterium]
MDQTAGRFDFAVIGAGIAGAGVARELAREASVVLIERETQPGYHTTGRSAALFSTTYGPAPIRALSRASIGFFRNPPKEFAATPLLSPRGVVMVARADQTAHVEAMLDAVADRGAMRRLPAKELGAMMPLLRPGYAADAVFEADASDIDVNGLHHGYLRAFTAAGGRIILDGEIQSLERIDGGWRIGTRSRDFEAGTVINAAGAWADEIARLAGATPAGLVPKRRTAMTVATPDGVDAAGWPMVVDIEEQFYLKPESGRLLLSPADETPSPPCDAQPEELDIAICVDRIETAFDLEIRAIENRWAGLRTFAPDKNPVVGYDPVMPGFFWLAGQGGYGIQTAPALARLAAALALGKPVPSDIADEGVSTDQLAPSRRRLAA